MKMKESTRAWFISAREFRQIAPNYGLTPFPFPVAELAMARIARRKGSLSSGQASMTFANPRCPGKLVRFSVRQKLSSPGHLPFLAGSKPAPRPV
jgi:hypothetical protein